MARGPCEIAFCCPSPPHQHCWAERFLCMGAHSHPVSSSHFYPLPSLLGMRCTGDKAGCWWAFTPRVSLQCREGHPRVTEGSISLFQVSSYRWCFLTMDLKQQQKRQNWELGQAGKEGKSTSSILSGSPFLWSLHFPFCSLGPHFTLEVSSAFMALPMAFGG